ncbi:hypothetical protein MKU65_02945 [Leptospira interrogans]|uniref:Uncharacterized protein n=2 Tax=Leptospira interrogans TaxID=173 RepID=A0A0F6ID20_LEPIR|nr:hypothetical protein [Leptospira interrogans]EMF43373.1 hypothetical protein LEP1GSC067_2371 [Leptospira interrogans serovar Lora str. TE 1992]EMJ35945.1 hypothetical protein LEP1GSC079_4915 [Leptospira interrogans str. FPW1039]EMJ48653.1 hypothetical protein LEP1GSC111_2974 [Leptospira interrogans str. UT126]MCH1887147.1 hypothetical protein [Leptospira interrogans]MCH1894638.1 hypothetical protein [Leptospira interrogans]
MEKAVPIKTPIGYFKNHRDGIILTNIQWSNSKIIFSCNITDNAILDATTKEKEYEFKLIFDGVISLFHAELDTYYQIEKDFQKPKATKSIFEEINNSDYIAKLPIRSDWGEVKHYCLSTYDDIFNILAKSYTFELL